jgi:hypothetical protein
MFSPLPPPASALQTTETIPYASHRSYSDLDQPLSAHDLGRLFGANPIPLLMPCHRVIRGNEIPDSFVGGAERRHGLMCTSRPTLCSDRHHGRAPVVGTVSTRTEVRTLGRRGGRGVARR